MEFGIIPDVFRTSSYPSPERCDLHLSMLKKVLLDRGLVRNLRNGEWGNYIRDHLGSWDCRAKELVRKLVNQNRLHPTAAVLADAPVTDYQWCAEAVASSSVTPLDGIIACQETAAKFMGNPLVASVEDLAGAEWWQDRGQSLYLPRQVEAYLRALGPVLSNANLLMFIDPHLDPSRPDYCQFVRILQAARRTDGCSPRIELHRVCYRGQSREVLKPEAWRKSFQEWDAPLRDANLGVSVYVWDDFHDRYLITNLVGVLMSRGFDASNAPNANAMWARIKREDREIVQREFDHNNPPFRTLHAEFRLGLP